METVDWRRLIVEVLIPVSCAVSLALVERKILPLFFPKSTVWNIIKVERSLLDTQGWKRNTLDSLLRSKEDHTAVKTLLESLKKS